MQTVQTLIKTALFFIPITALSISNIWAADRFASVEVKAQMISDSVLMLTGSGGNIGVSIGPDGTLIIDDQFAPLAEKIQAALVTLGGDRPRLILNTHFHGDHVGSNSWFANNQNSTIYAHDHVRERLSQDSDFNAAGLPAITFDSTLTFHLNNDTVRVFYLPAGHTDGDSAVWFEDANVLHPGDLFFNERFPFIDLKSGGDVDGYIANVEELLNRINDDTVIIPGHGPLANKQDYQGFLTMLKETKAEVDTMKQQGMTLDEAKTKGLSDKWDGWSWSFINEERWITTLY